MSEWYVFDERGAHRGPLSTDALAQAIRANLVPREIWVSAKGPFEEPGASGWHRVDDIPEITDRLTELRVSDLRVVDGGFKQNRLGSPEFGSKVMMIGSSRPPKPNDDE